VRWLPAQAAAPIRKHAPPPVRRRPPAWPPPQRPAHAPLRPPPPPVRLLQCRLPMRPPPQPVRPLRRLASRASEGCRSIARRGGGHGRSRPRPSPFMDGAACCHACRRPGQCPCARVPSIPWLVGIQCPPMAPVAPREQRLVDQSISPVRPSETWEGQGRARRQRGSNVAGRTGGKGAAERTTSCGRHGPRVPCALSRSSAGNDESRWSAKRARRRRRRSRRAVMALQASSRQAAASSGEAGGAGERAAGEEGGAEVEDESDKRGPPGSERSCGTQLSERQKGGDGQGQ